MNRSNKILFCLVGPEAWKVASTPPDHASLTLSVRMRRRRESMPGEFFTIMFKKKLTNNFYFVTFKCRKANDGDDDMKGGERWPVIARSVLEQPVVLRAIGDVACCRMGHWGCGPLSYGTQASGSSLLKPLGRRTGGPSSYGPLGMWPIVVRDTGERPVHVR